MKFRKKPVVVDAEWFRGPGDAHNPRGVMTDERGCYVTTAHGQRAYLSPGDWVIAEPDGRGFYPCKPDVFAATYEPAYQGEG